LTASGESRLPAVYRFTCGSQLAQQSSTTKIMSCSIHTAHSRCLNVIALLHRILPQPAMRRSIDALPKVAEREGQVCWYPARDNRFSHGLRDGWLAFQSH
jgi:hypothetical protein